MKARETISVWLVLEDGPNKGKFVLQKRAESEKHFPFVCQATWAGKVEPDETIENAVTRECQEEVGDDFAKNFDFSKLELLSKESFIMDDEEWNSYNYLGKIKEELLGLVKIHQDAESEFIFVDEGNLICSLDSGKSPKDNIVLFNDQYKVFKKLINENKK